MLVTAVLTCCFSSFWSSREQSVQGPSLPWHFDGLNALVTLPLAMPNSHLYMFRLESRSCELGHCDPGKFLAPKSSFLKCCLTFTETIRTIRDGKQTEYLNQTRQSQYLNRSFVVTLWGRLWLIFVLFSVPFCFHFIIIVTCQSVAWGKKEVAPKMCTCFDLSY